MSLVGVAKETLSIVEAGGYTCPSGKWIGLRAEIDRAIGGTRLYEPAQLHQLVRESSASSRGLRARIEVTPETTAQAARRLVQAEGIAHVAALNFASAKNPGGGFVGGAKAQEEDLARCSALYPCLLPQRAYYDANRAHASLLYLDHLIYSPEVPFFRDDRLELLDAPFCLSILTSPAPNAGEVLRRDPAAGSEIRATLEARAATILAVAAKHEHRQLVLGAWGCGVFRNDPVAVAQVFANLLASATFAGAFERVVFAVYDRSPTRENFGAFQDQFVTGGASS